MSGRSAGHRGSQGSALTATTGTAERVVDVGARPLRADEHDDAPGQPALHQEVEGRLLDGRGRVEAGQVGHQVRHAEPTACRRGHGGAGAGAGGVHPHQSLARAERGRDQVGALDLDRYGVEQEGEHALRGQVVAGDVCGDPVGEHDATAEQHVGAGGVDQAVVDERGAWTEVGAGRAGVGGQSGDLEGDRDARARRPGVAGEQAEEEVAADALVGQGRDLEDRRVGGGEPELVGEGAQGRLEVDVRGRRGSAPPVPPRRSRHPPSRPRRGERRHGRAGPRASPRASGFHASHLTAAEVRRRRRRRRPRARS